jgi:hypothetical protein
MYYIIMICNKMVIIMISNNMIVILYMMVLEHIVYI